jgi:Protein of unknown function (DUF3618)
MSTHEQSARELRQQIDATRRELGATVEQLAHKTSIKARVRDHVDEVTDNVKRTLGPHLVEAVAVGGAAIVLLIGWSLLHSRA